MAQKRPNLVQNMHFWSFWAKYCHFLHMLSNARPKNNVNKVPRWVFRYVGNKAFVFSSKKKGFFAQKRPNLAGNWHFCPWLAHLVPCWWVGWWLWRVGCVSQDIYFIVSLRAISVLINTKQLNEFRFTSIDPPEHNWESDLLVWA